LNTIKVGIKFTPPYGTTHPKGHKMVHRAAYHTGPRDVPLSLWLASIRGPELSVTPLSCPRPQVGLLSPFSLSSTLPFLHSATLSNLLLLLSSIFEQSMRPTPNFSPVNEQQQTDYGRSAKRAHLLLARSQRSRPRPQQPPFIPRSTSVGTEQWSEGRIQDRRALLVFLSRVRAEMRIPSISIL
jgi:hypothetical protein